MDFLLPGVTFLLVLFCRVTGQIRNKINLPSNDIIIQ